MFRMAAICYLSESSLPPSEGVNFALTPPPFSYHPPPTPEGRIAGSEKRINFSQQSAKMLKNGFKKLSSCFVVVFRSFSQNFPLGAPDNTD